MSFDSLLKQVLLSEQQLTEQAEKLKEVNVLIIRCKENIWSATEKYQKTTEELDEKSQQLSALRLQCNLMKKCEEQMLKKTEELLHHKNHHRQHLAEIKGDMREEKERFVQEISKFNEDFSLRGNCQNVFECRTETELQELESAVDSLYKEMEQIRRSNTQLVSVEEEKRALMNELQGLEHIEEELALQLNKARAKTESLRTESKFIHQKPLTDSTCLRLRRELEMHKEGDLERQRDILSSELLFLQPDLGNMQEGEQH